MKIKETSFSYYGGSNSLKCCDDMKHLHICPKGQDEKIYISFRTGFTKYRYRKEEDFVITWIDFLNNFFLLKDIFYEGKELIKNKWYYVVSFDNDINQLGLNKYYLAYKNHLIRLLYKTEIIYPSIGENKDIRLYKIVNNFIEIYDLLKEKGFEANPNEILYLSHYHLGKFYNNISGHFFFTFPKLYAFKIIDYDMFLRRIKININANYIKKAMYSTYETGASRRNEVIALTKERNNAKSQGKEAYYQFLIKEINKHR